MWVSVYRCGYLLISHRDSRRDNSRLRGTEAWGPEASRLFEHMKNAGNSNIHSKGIGWDYATFDWLIDLTLAPPWGQFRPCPALLSASEDSIGALWDHTLDSTLAYEADCGSLWCQFGITLGRVGVALTSLWGHFAHLGVGLGSLWVDFWIIWGSLCSCLAYEGPFSKTLVSLCFSRF